MQDNRENSVPLELEHSKEEIELAVAGLGLHAIQTETPSLTDEVIDRTSGLTG